MPGKPFLCVAKTLYRIKHFEFKLSLQFLLEHAYIAYDFKTPTFVDKCLLMSEYPLLVSNKPL